MSINLPQASSNICTKEKSIDMHAEQQVLNHISRRLNSTIGIEIPSKNCDIFCKTFESLCIGNCFFKSHDLECDIADLYRLHEKIAQVLKMFKNQRFLRAKIKIGDMRVNLKINRNDEPFATKDEIAQGFSSINLSENQDFGNSRVKVLEKQIESLELRLEIMSLGNVFFENYPESTGFQQFNETFDIKSTTEECDWNVRKFAIYQQKMLVEKEWDLFDAKILKAKYQKKLKKISAKKVKLQEQETHLRKENLDLEKEKSLMDKQKKAFETQKSRFQTQNQSRLQALKAFLSEVPYSPADLSINEHSPPIEISTIDTEISHLKQELQDLELQYKSKNSPNKQIIESQIEHVKTQLTTFRSMKVLQFKKNPLTKFPNSPNNLLEKSFSPKTFKKFDYKIDDLSMIKHEESDSELRKQLRIKELRIREKEEDVYNIEQRALKFWLNNLDTKEIIINLQTALTDTRRSKERYENRMEFFEKKKMELQSKVDEIVRREREIQKKKEILSEEKEDFEQEKREFLGKISNLIRVLE